MIVCKKCETLNTEDAVTCSECQASLDSSELSKNPGTKSNFAEQLRKSIDAGKLKGINSDMKTLEKGNNKETFAEQLAKSPFISGIQKIKSTAPRPLRLNMQVTSPHYDNIGKILTALKVNYKNYNGKFDCDILFMNCGSSDIVDTDELSRFVKKGGILYASDLTSSVISRTFPDIFKFVGDVGKTGIVTARVLDRELREVIDERIEIKFDLGSWSVLESITNGDIILRSEENEFPIMVVVPVNQGKVFYTCFHNHAQTSRQEEILLELLVLKQLGTSQSLTLRQTCMSMDIDLDSYKKEMLSLTLK